MANEVLGVLKLYNLDHHSRAIKDIFPELISFKMSGMYDYMNSRIIQDDKIKDIIKLQLKDDFDSIIESEIWFSEEEFGKRLKDNSAN